MYIKTWENIVNTDFFFFLDDHDALKFLTYSLYPPGTQPVS